ncbi:MAG TPA: ATP-binding cassette domain-containing protein [Acidimicrobiia bacterium]|nr:ATP-binding cassette domain-containing protein [Acidimicrobiia bacterium]
MTDTVVSPAGTAPAAEPGSGSSAPPRFRPPATRGSPYLTLALVLGAMALFRQFGPFGVSNAGNADLYNTWLFYGVIVVGFYFVFGVSGQFAFSQAAMAAVGGYTSAWATRVELLGTDSFLAGLAVGVVVTAIIATAFSFLMRRASEFYFAIGTLGLSSIVLEILAQWNDFTNSSGDSTTGISGIRIFGLQVSGTVIKHSKLSPKGFPVPVEPDAVQYRVFWIWLAAFAIVMLMAIYLARSPVQREAIAGRDQAAVAATVGVPVFRLRVTMFVLGSAIAGAAGSLFVHWKTFASPDSFGIDLGIGIFVMLILGGIDSRWGPILGAFFYVFIPQWLQGGVLGIPGPKFSVTLQGQVHNAGDFKNIIFGALLVVVMIAYPEGLVGAGRGVRSLVAGVVRPRRSTWFTRWLNIGPGRVPAPQPAGAGADAAPPALPAMSSAAETPASTPAPRAGAEPVLEAGDISVSFGGVHAVDGVSLTLLEGEILGLVGPNGSGKTTFLNAVNGVVAAHGSLRVGGRRIALGKPGRLRREQVMRAFQSPQTYEDLSCIEDVLLSTPDRSLTGITPAWFLRPWVLRHERARWANAVAALERVGLAELAEESTARLSYGQRRLLELARAMAAHPRILLLDEPSAGLNAAETDNLGVHLRALRAQGVSILLVDHKLDFITALCDRVAVLELGSLVAVGPAATVFSDQRVIDAYLGLEEGEGAHVLADEIVSGDGTAGAGAVTGPEPEPVDGGEA